MTHIYVERVQIKISNGGFPMNKILSILLSAVLLFLLSFPGLASSEKTSPDGISIEAPYAILMEAETGTVLYEKDAYVHRSPASVTKIMTMLLAAEAVDSGLVSLDEQVRASAKAAGMGGSQIWLEEGETMSFGEMLKCITVVSANDCCVAIAEHLAGSEEAFAARMNERARQLGLSDSNFTCCSGLSDSDEHYSCAYDLAVISRELLRHDFIRNYTGIWTDSIRNGEFGLSNTNKLIYHYPGATGLKTGFTSKAMHCLAASAERDGVEYIAVVLGAESSAARFESAKTLLSYAFANYTLLPVDKYCAIAPIKLTMGKKDCLEISVGECGKLLVPRSKASDISCETLLPDELCAPVEKGQKLGVIKLSSGGELIAEIPVLAGESVEAMGLFHIFKELLSSLMLR